MKKTYLIFFIFFLYILFNVQSKYLLDGYLLLTEKDTIWGQIDNKDYYSNSLYCDFKDLKTGRVRRYKPTEIYGYRFTNGKYYESKEVIFKDKKSILFLEYLINGKLDFYYIQDENGYDYYFVSKEGLPLKVLKYSEGIDEINGVETYVVNKDYTRILTFYTYDSGVMQDDVQNINKPDHKKLIKFAQKYNDIVCTDKKCIVYEKKIKHKVKFQPSTSLTYYFGSNLDMHIKPSIGACFLFQYLQRREDIYFGMGCFYDALIEYQFYEDLSAEEDVTIKDAPIIRFPFSYNYLNPVEGISPMFSFEIGPAFSSQVKPFLVNAFKFGFNNNYKKLSILFYIDVRTKHLLMPYGSSINFGLTYDIINH